MYHRFCEPKGNVPRCMPADVFRHQMEYVKKNYRPLKLCDLIAIRLRDGAYPKRAVVITVDDGYADFYRWAFPVLRELEISATVFVVTGLLDRNAWIWVDQLRYLCEHAHGVTVLSEENPRSLHRKLIRLPVAEREYRMAELAKGAKVSIPTEAPSNYALMSWKQLTEVAESSLIEIGSHSRTHPILAYLNAEDSWKELYGSRCEIQERLGVPVQSFAYPNGAPGDYRKDQVEMLCRAGYQCATVTDFGYVSPRSSRFTLPRIGGCGQDMTLFRKYVDGVEYIQRWFLGQER